MIGTYKDTVLVEDVRIWDLLSEVSKYYGGATMQRPNHNVLLAGADLDRVDKDRALARCCSA